MQRRANSIYSGILFQEGRRGMKSMLRQVKKKTSLASGFATGGN